MGGSNRYPVRTPTGLDIAGAVAIGRRIVADSAHEPLLEAIWTTSRTAVVAGVADLLTGAAFTLEMAVADPAPLWAAVAEVEADGVRVWTDRAAPRRAGPATVLVALDGEAAVPAALRLAPLGTTTWTVTLGSREDDVPADDAALDALVPVVGTDPLDVDWHCDWADAAVAYNGVRVLANLDTGTRPAPGRVSVAVYVNYRGGRDGAVAAAIAERSGVELGPKEYGY